MVYAGVDIGTSGCKMLVYDLQGNILFQAARTYQEEGTDGHRELNPKIVWENFLDMLYEVGKYCGESIKALSIASLGESIVCLDENDNVLANSMVTGDIRGSDEIRELTKDISAKQIFEITGLPPNELYGLPKYMWLNKNTDIIKKAKAIFFYEDFISYFLTGKRQVSYSSAARSLAFDIRKTEWSKRLLNYAGIDIKQMSEPVAPFTIIGTIKQGLADKIGLSRSMKVIVGGHDQSCAALGSGMLDSDTCECGMGTCEFMFMMMRASPRTTAYMMENDFTCIPYIIPGTWLTSLEITTCGILKNWAKNTLFSRIEMECKQKNRNFYEHMDALAAQVKTDVMVLPEFGSSGSPDLDMDTKGTITGFTIHTKPEEIYRGILESFGFQMRYAYKRLKKEGIENRKIIATGGGAKSDLTLQIRADIFQMDVLRLENDESGTLGCAIMAAVADQKILSLEQAVRDMVRVKKVYHPQHNAVKYYNVKYAKYEEFYKRMHKF